MDKTIFFQIMRLEWKIKIDSNVRSNFYNLKSILVIISNANDKVMVVVGVVGITKVVLNYNNYI